METNIENNAAPSVDVPRLVRNFTDTDRLNYLLQFISVDDVGDEEYCKGIVVNSERLEEEVGYGPMVNGRMEGTVKEWNDNLRDVIDRAMVAHGFANAELRDRPESATPPKPTNSPL